MMHVLIKSVADWKEGESNFDYIKFFEQKFKYLETCINITFSTCENLISPSMV